VFELTPPATVGGSWTQSVLWSFGNGSDGHGLFAGLIMDTAGNLYGTTAQGGNYGKGTAFELTPPSTLGDSWTESVLWNFGNGTDGSFHYKGSNSITLTMDTGGNLYGITPGGGVNGGGTAFELRPPSTKGGEWSESVLWNFGKGKDGVDPEAGLLIDGGGNLYGTTTGGGAYSTVDSNKDKIHEGTVFELTPPATSGGSWTESIVWNFNDKKGSDGHSPDAALIMDAAGYLYSTTGGRFSSNGIPNTGGGTYDEGTVFKIGSSLTASPTKLSFGNVVAPGTSKPKKVTLTNKGTLAAQITDVSATTPFTIAGGANTCLDKTIAPKGTCSFMVEFAPTTVGNVTGGSIDVTYNGSSPAVSLSGNAK